MHVASCSQIFGRFPTNKNYRPPLQQVSPAEQNRILFGRLAHLELKKWKSMKSFAKWNELGWPATFQHWGSEGFGEMKFFAEWNRGYFNIQSYFCSQKLDNEDFKMSMHCILYMFGWFAAANSAPKNQQGSTLNPVWNVPDISKKRFVETVVSVSRRLSA